MALFRNLCVNLRDSLCGVLEYASAQSLDFLDLAENCSFELETLGRVIRSFRMDTNYNLKWAVLKYTGAISLLVWANDNPKNLSTFEAFMPYLMIVDFESKLLSNCFNIFL